MGGSRTGAYSFGGDGFFEYTGEVFDLQTNGWKPLPPTSFRYAWCAAAMLGGLLYVVGENNAERFDPASSSYG